MHRGAVVAAVLAVGAVACAAPAESVGPIPRTRVVVSQGPPVASPTPGTPAGAAPPTAAGTSRSSPTSAAIRRTLRTLTERDYRDTYFEAADAPVQTSDGRGGTFSAVVAQRQPTADGHGQVIAFWHDKQFVGWAPRREVASVGTVVPGGPGAFDVEIALYAAGHALCCPSGSVDITFAWDGHAFVAKQQLPDTVDLGLLVAQRS